MVHPKCSEQDCKTCSTTSSPKKELDLLVIGAGRLALSLIIIRGRRSGSDVGEAER